MKKLATSPAFTTAIPIATQRLNSPISMYRTATVITVKTKSADAVASRVETGTR
jgi:hypothetical protein